MPADESTDPLAPQPTPAGALDVAAIGARAAEYTAASAALALAIDDDRIAATGEHDAVFARRDEAAEASADDVPALLAELARLRAHAAGESERVAAAVAGERTRLVAMLPWCDGAGRPNATHGHVCAARAEMRATWGRLDWQRRLCRDCAATFQRETAASIEPLPWAQIVREYTDALDAPAQGRE